MLNQNMTQGGTQAAGLGFMVGRCSSDGQHGRLRRHAANVGCSFFRYTNGELRNYTNQRCKHKHGIGMTPNLHYTASLGATIHEEDMG